MPPHDKEYLQEKLKVIPEYEAKGFKYGVIHSIVMFFLPGIRRLALYKRIPIAAVTLAVWMNWGYHFGRDHVYGRCNL